MAKHESRPQQRGGQLGTTTAADSDVEPKLLPEIKPALARLSGSRQRDSSPVPPANVVKRPVPVGQAKDPRAFQIAQVKRRYSPKEIVNGDGSISLIFILQPSDPDFPFELPQGLNCILHISREYAASGNGGEMPKLEVENQEIGEQWRRRIESGFLKLAIGLGPRGTLLGLLNRLDRELEGFLTDKQPELVTIVPNRPREGDSGGPEQPKDLDRPLPQETVQRHPQIYTSRQIEDAAQVRKTEVGQVEARLGRLPGFTKSTDGIVYTIPLTPRKPQELPQTLRSLNLISLSVPERYPLQHCRIQLPGLAGDQAARRVEQTFEAKAIFGKGNLMGHINTLAQNVHIYAVESSKIQTEKEPLLSFEDSPQTSKGTDGPANSSRVDDRSHLQVVPRPPEWDITERRDASSGSEESDSYESEDESGEGDAKVPSSPEHASSMIPHTNPERGISLSLPLLELYSIELLEITLLSISVKCLRCKSSLDVHNLRNSSARNESCKKCASPFTICYRRELIHINSFRAGFLDLDGCTVLDLLSSTFLPTCSQCSSAHPAPGVVSVRGASTMAICRECHAKMTFKIPEVKFLLVSAAARSAGAPVRKKPKEKLGITAGEELPKRGRCQHYSKSYRWFRFSCCERVFPCDRCHDAETDHPNEHANRMICGFCSREQNYRSEDCGFCKASVIKKAGSGFWEGGKGTRDKARMSRKGEMSWSRASERS